MIKAILGTFVEKKDLEEEGAKKVMEEIMEGRRL